MYKRYWVTKDGDSRSYNLALGDVTISLDVAPKYTMLLATLQGKGGIRTGVERWATLNAVYGWFTLATNKRDYKTEVQFSVPATRS
jgi:hypothetical protein